MFTGVVDAAGSIKAIERAPQGARLTIATALAGEVSAGDSVAVNGVCLTAVAVDDESLSADVIAETLRRSSLGQLEDGDGVNIELAVGPGDRLGGHLVQGHVDGLGTIDSSSEDGLARVLRIAAPPEILRYVVEKGSIAVDGVSLTVVDVGVEALTVALIPETLARTTLAAARPGRVVNLEVDVIAKYVEKLARNAIGPAAAAR